jgi:hypothetical protein
LPTGLCAQCLESSNDPKTNVARYLDVGSNQGLWLVYCEHNRCGAYTFAGIGAGTQWALYIPIELSEFLKLVKTAVKYYLAAERPNGDQLKQF